METPPLNRRKKIIIVGSLFGLLVFCCVFGEGILEPPFLVAVYLGFGWLWYLTRVLPQVSPDAGSILTGVLCLVSLTVGLHYSLRWLHGRIQQVRTGTAAT